MTMSTRAYWVDTMCRIADPVMEALAEQRLKATMPTKGDPSRKPYMHLEALGRLLAGMAPWLESGEVSGAENDRREKYAELARQAIRAGVDPQSPDHMNFERGEQPLVDGAFLALAILRAPMQLWDKLDARTQNYVIAALKKLRRIKPPFCNWLLFAALIEACLCKIGEQWDPMRVDYALKQHEQWYLGDGMYADGEEFAWDYYNSFVIQPMLLELLDIVGDQHQDWKAAQPVVAMRAKRHAAILERMISPEGTFPPIGRSLAYRFGAFHALAQMALREDLPHPLLPAQVRCGLTAVIRRMAEAPGFQDQGGWLNIGWIGEQPGIGEHYISTGSLYLCSLVFLPLGLSASAPFWNDADADWTSRKAWSGVPFAIDHQLSYSR